MGTALTIEADTRYPFEETVRFTLTPAHPARFTFSVRIPEWCREPILTINGQDLGDISKPGTFQRIEREWFPGDRLIVKLPFALALKRWPQDGISLELGPLTLSLPVEAPLVVETVNDSAQTPAEFRLSNLDNGRQNLPGFPSYRLMPSSPWAYALALDENTLTQQAKVTWNPPSDFPLDLGSPALRVSVPVRKVKDWMLVETDQVIRALPSFENGIFSMLEGPLDGHFILTPPLPDPETLPARLADEVEWIDLVPYGNTLLRLTIFPDGAKYGL
jgi:hypothetical protein